MKFIHAADVHLDSPLQGLDRYDGAPVEKMRRATRRALENLVDLCIDERATFLLIAGDLYDGDWRDYNTGLFFVSQMGRLASAGVEVFLIKGNHDAQSQISKTLRLPDGVHDLSTKAPVTIQLDGPRIAIHGQGYSEREITCDLSAAYPPPVRGYVNIGLLHTAAGGREGHANYAPCTPLGLTHKGYDYWALGHVHQREILQQDPWIVFPGNLQGRHARETGAKGASIVTVDDGRLASVEHRPLDVVRWARARIDLSNARSSDDALEAVSEALSRAQLDAEGRPLAIRITLTGASKAHAAIVRAADHFKSEVRALGTHVEGGGVWIEKIEVSTRPQQESRESRAATTEGPIGDLLRALRDTREDDAELLKMAAELKELKLPDKLLMLDPTLDFQNLESIKQAIDGAESMLLSHLLGTAEEA